jgi:hypothetical protein
MSSGNGAATAVFHGLVGDFAVLRARAFELEHVGDVPGDCLAFAVGVGREQDAIGCGRRCFEFGDRLLRSRTLGDVFESQRFWIDAYVFLRQVADMAAAGAHGVTGAENTFEFLALAGRLDDKQGCHGCTPGERYAFV